jgi:hypothetical protein
LVSLDKSTPFHGSYGSRAMMHMLKEARNCPRNLYVVMTRL